MISRRKLSQHAATRLSKGDTVRSVMKELAAYLVETRRTRELELIIRDIETALADNGTVLARITSARKLTERAEAEITEFVKGNYTGSTRVVLEENLDESLIGGVKIVLPGKQLDASVKTRLETLTAN